MKKVFKNLFVSILATGLLASCNAPASDDKQGGEGHVHTYAETWTNDENGHWHPATCGHNVKGNFAAHTFGDWYTKTDATETQTGIKARKCSVCEFEDTQIIPVKEHTHTYSEDWTSDATGHWHAATCAHTDQKQGFAAHTFGEWAVTKEATETEEGTKQRTCSVCNYAETASIPMKEHTHKFEEGWTSDATNHWHAATCGHDVKDGVAAHEFGEWTVTKEATEIEEGSKQRTCSVCSYVQTEVIPTIGHVHTFAEGWTYDATNHWHAATCGHEVKDGEAAHTFGEWTVTKEATETEKGSKQRTCSVCNYVDVEEIPVLEHTHTFEEGWTSDETNHWHAATCGHDVKGSEAAHTFGEWTTTTTADEGYLNQERSCTVCNYKETRKTFEKKINVDYGLKTEGDYTVSDGTDGIHIAVATNASKGYDGLYLPMTTSKVELASEYSFVIRNNGSARIEARIAYRNTTVNPRTFGNSLDVSDYSIFSLNNRSNTKLREVKDGFIKFNIEAGDTGRLTIPMVTSEYDQFVLIVVHADNDCDLTLIQTDYKLGVEHHLQEGWSHDAEHHWKACTDEGCEFIAQKATHTWVDDESKTNVPATAEHDGVDYKVCSVCGETKEVVTHYNEGPVEVYATWTGKNTVYTSIVKGEDGKTTITLTQTNDTKYEPLVLNDFNDLIKPYADKIKTFTIELKNLSDFEFHGCLALKDDSAVITDASSAEDATGGVSFKRHSSGSGEYFNIAANGEGTLTGHIASGKTLTKVRIVCNYDQFDVTSVIQIGKITLGF